MLQTWIESSVLYSRLISRQESGRICPKATIYLTFVWSSTADQMEDIIIKWYICNIFECLNNLLKRSPWLRPRRNPRITAKIAKSTTRNTRRRTTPCPGTHAITSSNCWTHTNRCLPTQSSSTSAPNTPSSSAIGPGPPNPKTTRTSTMSSGWAPRKNIPRTSSRCHRTHRSPTGTATKRRKSSWWARRSMRR